MSRPVLPCFVSREVATQIAREQSESTDTPHAVIAVATIEGEGRLGYYVLPAERVTATSEVRRLRARVRELEERCEELAGQHDYSAQLRASIGRVR